MFIIERRTAGVFAALLIPAAMAALSNIWDRDRGIANSSSAASTAAFATSVGPGLGQVHSLQMMSLDPALSPACTRRGVEDRHGFRQCPGYWTGREFRSR
jgi:MFS family permease